MRHLSLIAVLTSGLVSPAEAQSLTAPSVWMNQRGSELDIDSVDGNGKITGHFTNNASGFECKGTKVDVAGQAISGNEVTFAADFAACYTLTSWLGSVQGKTLTTTWVLFYPTKTGAVETLHDSDVFTQTAP
jgi:hypothetical protein